MAAPDQTTNLTVGDVVADTYKVTSLLGSGGMGAVFAAEHVRLPGNKVAIKVLHRNVASPEAIARFQREAEIASRLGHPGIVKVIDFNQLHDGSPYIIMEYLIGKTLADRMTEKPLSVEEGLAIIRQIASALEAAHSQGVIHRDLKPQNVFLCPLDVGGTLATQVKILDFGISKIQGSQTVQTKTQVMLGTPQYMAPEQADSTFGEIGPVTDIFSLGVMAYEMFAQVPAFRGNSIAAVVFQVVYQDLPDLCEKNATVPRGLAQVIERCCAKKQPERFQSVRELLRALSATRIGTDAGAGRIGGSPDSTLPVGSGAPLKSDFATDETMMADEGQHFATDETMMADAGQHFATNETTMADSQRVIGANQGADATAQTAMADSQHVSGQHQAAEVMVKDWPSPGRRKRRWPWLGALAVIAIGGAAFGLRGMLFSSSSSEKTGRSSLAANSSVAVMSSASSSAVESTGLSTSSVKTVSNTSLHSQLSSSSKTSSKPSAKSIANSSRSTRTGPSSSSSRSSSEKSRVSSSIEQGNMKAWLGAKTRAQKAVSSGDYAGAIRIAKQAVNAGGPKLPAYFFMGQVACKWRNRSAANDYLRRVTRMSKRKGKQLRRRCAKAGFELNI